MRHPHSFTPRVQERTRRLSPPSRGPGAPSRPLLPAPPPLRDPVELTVPARPAPGGPRARKTKGIPAIVLAPSVTSTSKAVACAVISTAGNVTARPTAQTTTSARALVSSGRAALLVLLRRRPTGARPGPALPAARPFPASSGIAGGAGRAPPRNRPPGTPGRCGGSSRPGPEGSAPRAPEKQPRGCRSAAGADGIRRPPRPRAAAFPRSARRELPPRLRAAPPAPLPPRAHRGGWAAAGSRPPPAPRSPRPPPGRLPARVDAGGASRGGAAVRNAGTARTSPGPSQ